MNHTIKRLTQSKFVRNVAMVATGTAGAQAITILFSPVITRFYGPEAFGILGTFLAILAVLTPIAALTYPIAIVLPRSDTDAKTLAKLSVILSIVVSTIVAFLLLIAGDKIARILGLEAIVSFLLFIPVAMLFSAFLQTLTQWLIRKKQFKITARVAVIQSLTVNLFKTAVGFFYPLGAALISIATIGYAWHAILLWIGIKKRNEAQADNDNSTGTVREMAKRHSDFPLYRAPEVFLSALSMNIPVILLAGLFEPAVAGFYTLGKTVLGAPSALISKSVASVIYPKASESISRGQSVFKLILKATLGLIVIGLIPLSVVIFFGPSLFSLVFGDEWIVSGDYARWLAVFMFFHFINTPSVSAIPVLRMQRWFLGYSLWSAGLRVGGLLIGYVITKDPLTTIAFFSVLGSVAYAYLIWRTIGMARNFLPKKT